MNVAFMFLPPSYHERKSVCTKEICIVVKLAWWFKRIVSYQVTTHDSQEDRSQVTVIDHLTQFELFDP